MQTRSQQVGILVAVIIVLGIGWVMRGNIREAVVVARRPELPLAQPFIAQPSSTVAVAATASSSTAQPSTQPLSQTGVTVVTPSKPSSTSAPAPVIEVPSKDSLPATVNLAVPFLSQAPKQNWSMPYQEACEEASMIMVDAYLSGRTRAFLADEGDRAILNLVAYEEQIGKTPDLTAAEIKQVVDGYFKGRQVELLKSPTIQQIKEVLTAGFPVIVPASGKALKNPNFRNGGPVYHMLVIKGYLKDGRWITNDPGTRNGADYLYDQKVLFNAIHDWNGGDVPAGNPVVIVIK